jgi:hypothetical protein
LRLLLDLFEQFLGSVVAHSLGKVALGLVNAGCWRLPSHALPLFFLLLSFFHHTRRFARPANILLSLLAGCNILLRTMIIDIHANPPTPAWRVVRAISLREMQAQG